MVEASLNSFGVVEAFDVVEQGGPQRGSIRPNGALMYPGELAFECGEERLDGGVVVAAADRAEGLIQLEFGEPAGERQRGVNGAAVGMMNHAPIRSSAL